jgi:ComF family protein
MLTAWLSFVQRALSDLFFPRTCSFCDSPHVGVDSCLCETCRDSLRFLTHSVCHTCGLPVPGVADAETATCGRCLTQPPRYTMARYGTYYEGPLKDALVRFKYHAALHTGPGLSELLIQAFHRHFDESEFDVIVPVPIHLNKLRQRGFNQALVLAQRLSAETGIPLNRTTLKKMKDTPPQVGLTRRERLTNLKGAFGISKPAVIRDRRVLLVDDVATTGSTIAECSRTIVSEKAARVDVLVLALRSDAAKEDLPQPVARAADYKV